MKRRLREHVERVRAGLAVRLLGAMVRERERIRASISSTEGMMALLMKARNRQRWTVQERKQLLVHLRSLSTVSPYIMVLAFPGSIFFLPVMAWWLDRRRQKRKVEENRAASQR